MFCFKADNRSWTTLKTERALPSRHQGSHTLCPPGTRLFLCSLMSGRAGLLNSVYSSRGLALIVHFLLLRKESIQGIWKSKIDNIFLSSIIHALMIFGTEKKGNSLLSHLLWQNLQPPVEKSESLDEGASFSLSSWDRTTGNRSCDHPHCDNAKSILLC